jgi:hypothetical protein
LIKENSRLLVRVIGVRFELNDQYVSVIGKLLEKLGEDQGKKKPIIILDNE